MGATTSTVTAAYDASARAAERSLPLRRYNPRTIDSYLESLRSFVAFTVDRGARRTRREFHRAEAEAWIVEVARLPARCHRPGALHASFRSSSARWCVAEGRIATDPTDKINPPSRPRVPSSTAGPHPGCSTRSTPPPSVMRRRHHLESCCPPALRAGRQIRHDRRRYRPRRHTITVIGKGDRQRTVAIGDRASSPRPPRTVTPVTPGSVGGVVARPQGGAHRLRRPPDHQAPRDTRVSRTAPAPVRHTFAHRWLARGSTERTAGRSRLALTTRCSPATEPPPRPEQTRRGAAARTRGPEQQRTSALDLSDPDIAAG